MYTITIRFAGDPLHKEKVDLLAHNGFEIIACDIIGNCYRFNGIWPPSYILERTNFMCYKDYKQKPVEMLDQLEKNKAYAVFDEYECRFVRDKH